MDCWLTWPLGITIVLYVRIMTGGGGGGGVGGGGVGGGGGGWGGVTQECVAENNRRNHLRPVSI